MTDQTNSVPKAEPVPPPSPPADATPRWLAWLPPAYRPWVMSLLAALLLALIGAVLRHLGVPWNPPAGPQPMVDGPPVEVVVQDEGPVFGLLPGEDEPELTIRADQLAEVRDWGHGLLGLRTLHAQGYDGAGVVIAVLDTGVDADHPDLAGKLAPGAKDFTGSDSGTADKQNHGTHVTGISVSADNGAGVVGAAPGAKVLNVKVLNDQGSGRSSWIAEGIRYAADMGADVINLSLGGPNQDARTRQAIEYAIGKGCWVVAAAGNDGKVADNFPGHYPNAVAVASVAKDGQRSSFSTTNPENDVAAPGSSVLSTLPGGKYGTMSGTSMATPYVSGCLALVRGALKKAGKPVPSQPELLTLLAKHSRDIDPAGHDAETGHGLISPAKLLTALVGTKPPPPPAPPAKGTFEVSIELDKLAEVLRKAGWTATPPGK